MMKYLLILNYVPSSVVGGEGTVVSDDETSDSICTGWGTHCTNGHIGPCEGVGGGTVR